MCGVILVGTLRIQITLCEIRERKGWPVKIRVFYFKKNRNEGSSGIDSCVFSLKGKSARLLKTGGSLPKLLKAAVNKNQELVLSE